MNCNRRRIWGHKEREEVSEQQSTTTTTGKPPGGDYTYLSFVLEPLCFSFRYYVDFYETQKKISIIGTADF
jgi:hypothetical protein